MMSLEIDRCFLRMFDPETDYELLAEWWNHRNRTPAPPREMLPKLGVIAINMAKQADAMAFLFMDNSTGVCFFEFPVSRPGLSLKESHNAFDSIMEFLKSRAVALGYGVMIGYTFPALVKQAQRYGFRVARKNMTMLSLNLKGEQ